MIGRRVDPSHYWTDVGNADCTCGAKVGFMLEVDDLRRAVLTYTPGIDGVVC